MSCPVTKMRADQAPLPDRMKYLAIDQRGYVVPWFVPIVDGQPEFRCMDVQKFHLAVRLGLCWVCGGYLGTHRTFITGPMCLISGTNAEPPSHWVCATYAARNCPFLSKPQMVRRENDLPENMEGAAGIPILRNPGVTAVATMKSYLLFHDDAGKPLIEMKLDTLEHVEWFREGRPATRAEVQHSVATGLEILMPFAERDGPRAIAEVNERLVKFAKLLPAE
jgi:hypothetical protein